MPVSNMSSTRAEVSESESVSSGRGSPAPPEPPTEARRELLSLYVSVQSAEVSSIIDDSGLTINASGPDLYCVVLIVLDPAVIDSNVLSTVASGPTSDSPPITI